MDDIFSAADFDECQSPKTRGGITLKKTNLSLVGGVLNILDGDFDFDFECICGTSVVIPVPIGLVKNAITNLLRSKAPRALLQIARLARGNMFAKVRNRALDLLNQKLATVTARYNKVLARQAKYASESSALRKRLGELTRELGLSESQLKSFAKRHADEVAAYKRWGCPRQGDKVCDGFYKNIQGFKNEYLGWKDRSSQLKQQMKEVTQKQSELVSSGKEFNELYNEKTKLELERNSWEGSGPNNTDLDAMLDALPPEVRQSFLDNFLSGFFWVLEKTAIVQEKNCLSNQSGLPEGLFGADLDRNTCRCSVCTPGYPNLCDLSTWVGDNLPSAPGARQSDEFNVCMKCCDNAKPQAKWYTGGIIGYTIQELFSSPPCSCECPEDFQGYKMEWFACDGDNSCTRGPFNVYGNHTCRRKESHYSGMNYRWDTTACAWVCADPCGQDCCTASEVCLDGSSGNKCCCQSAQSYCNGDGTCSDCPPGYTNVNSPTGMLGIQQTECVENCLADSSICGTDCCEFSYLASTPSGPAPIGICLPCPDKTRALRFEEQNELTMNPWNSRSTRK